MLLQIALNKVDKQVYSCQTSFSFEFYTGDMLAPVKVLDAENAIVYMTFDGKKAAILYTIDGECWEAQNIMPYTTTRPTAVKGAKGWLLKAGTPTATSPAKRKTTTGASSNKAFVNSKR